MVVGAIAGDKYKAFYGINFNDCRSFRRPVNSIKTFILPFQ